MHVADSIDTLSRRQGGGGGAELDHGIATWCPIAEKRGMRSARDLLRESATSNIPRRIALL
jgi:hypothetical protein